MSDPGWKRKISEELMRLAPGQHPGKVRSTARRIAGIALQELATGRPGDFLALLNDAANNTGLPAEIRAAAHRLAARLSPEFESPSSDPIGDAQRIVDYVSTQLSE